MIANKKSPKVSCLLLNWNGVDLTRKCLRSLLKTNYPNFEIIVVDNGSKNDEVDSLKKEFGKVVTVVASDVNLGYAGGMNLAYKNSSGDYVMFLNNDMEFKKDWLLPLVDILKKNKYVGGTQPKISDVTRKDYYESGGAAGGFMDILGYPFARGRVFSEVERDNGQYEEVVKITWAGIILVRRDILKKIGVFNPIYFNYGEDMDLCYRIYGLGYIIVNVPSSVVYHVGGAILKKNMSKKFFFHHRNNMIFLLINDQSSALWLKIPARILLDFVTIFYYGLTGFPNLSLSVVKAYGSLVTMLGQILNARRATQKLIIRKHMQLMPVYKGSIVWQYYITRNRTFNKIMTEPSVYEF